MTKAIVTLTIQDAGGKKSPVSVYVSASPTDSISDLNNIYVEPFWNSIRTLITGVLVGAKISLESDISDYVNNSPVATSDIQEKALFKFLTAATRNAFHISLPTINETTFENFGKGSLIDVTNSDVQFFIAAMTNDVADNGINATDAHEQDLSLFETGYQSWGK